LYTGYGRPKVAATVGYIQDGDRRVVTDPGMVRHRSLILDPLAELGVEPEQVTDVVFGHHHPDHTLNAALFPNARFHDHWAIYPCRDPTGAVAFTHLWNDAASVGDRHAVDLEALHAGRRRVLAVADVIVPGHGPAFTPDPSATSTS
jgi:glyoxylase-like metal-dependent hydrolase (beta-lactamase superfamily II)